MLNMYVTTSALTTRKTVFVFLAPQG